MDHKLSLARVGWSVSFISVLLHVVALARINMLTGPPRELVDQLVAIGHPGYALTPAGVTTVLLEAFIYAWIVSALFVFVYNWLLKRNA